jgi:hypothetical protein
MADATKLVAGAAGEAAQDIVERYEGYHAHLVSRFVEVLRIQHSEPGDRAQRRSIQDLVSAFAGEVTARLEEDQ